MINTRRPHLLTASIALAGVIGLAACGGGGSGNGVASASGATTEDSRSSDPSGGAGAPSEEQALKFAKCMRTHGVKDFPDPKVGGQGEVTFGFRAGSGKGQGPSFRPDDPTFKAAQEACKKYAPNGGNFKPSPEQQAKMADAQLKFAKCMRDKGYDVPDPDTSNSGESRMIIGPGSGLDPDDPDVRKAMDECQKVFRDILGEGNGPSFRSGGGSSD